LWDNGNDPADELNRVMEVRQVALKNFGENTIKPGTPYALLEEAFVPVYFFHRYQAEAAVKLIGGLNYRYALRGDGQPITELLTPQQELKAMDALMKTVSPSALMVPENLLRMMPPRPIGYDRHRELVKIKTELTFDPLTVAETAADFTFSMMLHPARVNRLFEHHSRDAKLPSLESVLDKMISATIKSANKTGYEGAVQMSVNYALLSNLIKLAMNDKETLSQTRGIAQLKLDQLKIWLLSRNLPDESWKSHYAFLAKQIVLFQEDPEEYKQDRMLPVPPGAPIGMTEWEFCGN
jgi:hypothetical protein